MYNIGKCKICNQGLLEIVKDKESGIVYICCDECEAEWEKPEDALIPQNGTRNKFGLICYPSTEEIENVKRRVKMFEHCK